MVLTLLEAKIGKTYRIKEMVDMSHRIIERLRLQGIVRETKIVLLEITSYNFCLIEAIHPNGELVRSSVPNKAAERIHLSDPNESDYWVVDVVDTNED